MINGCQIPRHAIKRIAHILLEPIHFRRRKPPLALNHHIRCVTFNEMSDTSRKGKPTPRFTHTNTIQRISCLWLRTIPIRTHFGSVNSMRSIRGVNNVNRIASWLNIRLRSHTTELPFLLLWGCACVCVSIMFSEFITQNR